ncbi:MAG: DUF4990 domain-containing protein, partial [Bacteroidia bacterium]|nr:DUF4990 domain-containing protein [Bacteroidia bacterium]
MKRIYTLRSSLYKLVSFFFLLITVHAEARVFYLSPTGNDNGAGTNASPWFTLNKAWAQVAAGDTIYLRGGTYNYTSQQYLIGKNGTNANMIKVWNYPGEKPNLTQGSGWPGSGQDFIYFGGNYVHWKGIEISYCNRSSADWAAFRSESPAANNCIFEQIDYHHNQLGFTIRECNNNLVLNSDFHHNQDAAGDNADGINITYVSNGSFSNTIRGCRAWNNSDDGFDFWANQGYVLIEDSWAWRNGYAQNGTTPAGDGSGFKFGAYTGSTTALKRTAQRCVAYDNRLWGFNENNCQTGTNLYNNIAYANGNKSYWFGDWGNHVMDVRNNIHFQAPNGYTFSGGAVIATNNSWQSGMSVASSDFQNLTSQLGNPRQSDGALPNITFLHLVNGSNLIDAGINVGLSFLGTAPDLGAFETGGAAPPPANQPPTANAGTDRTITLPVNNVTLNGSGTDPDGTIA